MLSLQTSVMSQTVTGYIIKGQLTEVQRMNYHRQVVQKEKAAVWRRKKTTNARSLADKAPEELANARSVYGVRRLPCVQQNIRIYDRLHSVDPSWDQKVKKENQKNLTKYKLNAKQEDHYRAVALLGNSAYGHHLNRPLEDTKRKEHAHVNVLLSSTYRKHGVDLSGGYPMP